MSDPTNSLVSSSSSSTSPSNHPSSRIVPSYVPHASNGHHAPHHGTHAPHLGPIYTTNAQGWVFPTISFQTEPHHFVSAQLEDASSISGGDSIILARFNLSSSSSSSSSHTDLEELCGALDYVFSLKRPFVFVADVRNVTSLLDSMSIFRKLKQYIDAHKEEFLAYEVATTIVLSGTWLKSILSWFFDHVHKPMKPVRVVNSIPEARTFLQGFAPDIML